MDGLDEHAAVLVGVLEGLVLRAIHLLLEDHHHFADISRRDEVQRNAQRLAADLLDVSGGKDRKTKIIYLKTAAATTT
jgi:hypothetical protein